MKGLKVPDVVESIVENDIIYKLSLRKGIANSNALARKIKPEVDRITGHDIPINTIAKILARRFRAIDQIDGDIYDALNEMEISLEYGYTRSMTESEELLKYNFKIAIKLGQKYEILYKDESSSEFALLKLKLKEVYSETPGITVLIISILELYEISVRYTYRMGHEIWFLIDSEYGSIAAEKLLFLSRPIKR